MSRHRKLKNLDYYEDYDDDFYDDDDFDEDAFEAQYLSSGIDLNSSKSNNTKRQTIIDEVQPPSLVSNDPSLPITSDLTKLAIQHLDKHQWQLPLMEMDKKFRDKTYYKHYTDTYMSSLGHFLADNQLISNPMKYHVQQELDNYSKYSRMLGLLTDYYQSLGRGFFSFATPSPDEEIVIGCRLGTKGYYRQNRPWSFVFC